jgi:hypothetical protein
MTTPTFTDDGLKRIIDDIYSPAMEIRLARTILAEREKNTELVTVFSIQKEQIANLNGDLLAEREELAKKVAEAEKYKQELRLIGQNICGVNWETEKDITLIDVYSFVEGQIEKQSDLRKKAEANLAKASSEHQGEIERLKAGGDFHPLRHSEVLNQPGSTLENYIVRDTRRDIYVSERLLKVVLLAYLKHHKQLNDVIGWNALEDELHNCICEAIGDDEFCKWSETTSNA